jgi:hypothetical protein
MDIAIDMRQNVYTLTSNNCLDTSTANFDITQLKDLASQNRMRKLNNDNDKVLLNKTTVQKKIQDKNTFLYSFNS